MSWEATAEQIARSLKITLDGLAPPARSALVLARAGSELARHSPDAGQTSHTFRVLLRWLQLVDSGITAPVARELMDHAHPTTDPEWLRYFQLDLDASRHLPTPLVMLALLALVPPGHSQIPDLWRYLDEAAIDLAVPPEAVQMFRGWLDGAASASVTAAVEAQLAECARINDTCAALATALRELAEAVRAEAARAGAQPLFLEARQRVLEEIAVVLRHVETLGVVRTPLLRLKEYAAHDHFRLAVLGEFKRGKSTLINALVEMPDLMPADSLPSTSTLTELRYDRVLRYEVQDAAQGDSYVPATAEAFREQVGSAARSSSTAQDAEARAARVPRWRVWVPSRFLEQSFVELIDSPGLGEDYARDHIAREEALRADAAILVFNARQVASQQELDLVDHMQSKLENLIIALNQADLVPERDWERIRAHVAHKLQQRGLSVPPDRLVFVSALEAEDAVRVGNVRSSWLARMERLRGVVQQHILARSGPRKAKVLAGKVLDAVEQGRRDVAATLSSRKKKLEDLKNLQSQREEAQAQYARAQCSVRSAVELIADHRAPARRLMEAFRTAQAGIFEEVGRQREAWRSEFHPLTSPKRHVQDVGEQVKRAVLDATEAWFKTEGAAVLVREITEKLDLAMRETAELRAYLQGALGRSPEEITQEMESLKANAMEEAFGAVDLEGGGVGALTKVLVGSVAAMVVGYVIADIVLYYVLGVVSGFLNPVLLLAAVAAGVMLWVSRGEEWVRDWIKGQVLDRLREGFLAEAAQERLAHALERAMEDTFRKLARGFRDSAEALLDETRAQQLRIEDELRRLAERGRSPEELARDLAEEVQRLERAAGEALRAYDALEQIAHEVWTERVEASSEK